MMSEATRLACNARAQALGWCTMASFGIRVDEKTAADIDRVREKLARLHAYVSAEAPSKNRVIIEALKLGLAELEPRVCKQLRELGD